MIYIEVEFFCITCPVCRNISYTNLWNPGRCPYCGDSLSDYTSADLRTEPRIITVSIDQLTGQAVVVP